MSLESEQALTQIYNDTYDDILRYVLVKCPEPFDAPDIVQNAYLKLYKRLQKRGDIEDPLKYLYAIVRHELFRHYRWRAVEKNNVPVFSTAEEEEFRSLEQELSEEYDGSLFIQNEIWDEIALLEATTFKIFILHFKFDLTLSQISKELNLKESTVKSRMYRALKTLRNRF